VIIAWEGAVIIFSLQISGSSKDRREEAEKMVHVIALNA
jgi:hypothetical protein